MLNGGKKVLYEAGKGKNTINFFKTWLLCAFGSVGSDSKELRFHWFYSISTPVKQVKQVGITSDRPINDTK